MALDGITLRHVKKELEEKLIDSRVDKIHQPNREEIIISFRSREGSHRVLFSARANSARVHLTKITLENPRQPPMLCMLLRKRLMGSRLIAIRQPGLERVLHFDFDSLDELNDHVTLTLTAEIMGRYSNIILCGEDGRIIDALKRVDAEMSSQRLILPGLGYTLPPPQKKASLLEIDEQGLKAALRAIPGDKELSGALLSVLQGVSPIVCRELAYRAGRGRELTVKTMDEERYFRVGYYFHRLKELCADVSGTPCMAVSPQGKPIDLSFFEMRQYGSSAIVKRRESFSELLDDFYSERDRQERMRVRESDLLKLLSINSERLSRKIAVQGEELKKCARRDELRIAGDLISANLYSLEKGAPFADLPNYYEEGQPTVRIKLDPALTPSQNAQRYYKEYRKAKTAEEKLKEQIGIAQNELLYLDSVLDSLSRAETEQELQEIRAELSQQGYVKKNRDKKRREPDISAPLRFTVSDGFTVLVGKNNRQNDRLTLKTAGKNDYWFHTKNIPGSHTVLLCEGREPTEKAMEDAARLAAEHSRGKDSSRAAVDYTRVRYVSKPQGAKPGMVIYVNYKTIYINLNNEK